MRQMPAIGDNPANCEPFPVLLCSLLPTHDPRLPAFGRLGQAADWPPEKFKEVLQ